MLWIKAAQFRTVNRGLPLLFVFECGRGNSMLATPPYRFVVNPFLVRHFTIQQLIVTNAVIVKHR